MGTDPYEPCIDEISLLNPPIHLPNEYVPASIIDENNVRDSQQSANYYPDFLEK